MWKWFYYAPNTFKELQIAKLVKNLAGVRAFHLTNDEQQQQATGQCSQLTSHSLKKKAVML